jgi:hypothetical protein
MKLKKYKRVSRAFREWVAMGKGWWTKKNHNNFGQLNTHRRGNE